MPASPETEIIGPPFAKPSSSGFWASAVAAVLTGGLLGLVTVGYVKAINLVPQFWYLAGNPNYPDDPSTLYWAKGKVWWIAVGAGAGVVTGAVKALSGMDEFPSFIKDLKERQVDAWMSIRIFGLTLVSMFGGAPLGPEAGLGALGSLAGQTAGMLVRMVPVSGCKEVDPRELTTAGAAAALSGLLPSPYLSMLLVGEAAGWPDPRVAALIFLSTMAASAVYGSIEPKPYLSGADLYLAQYFSMQQTPYDFALGILFGLMGAVLAFVYFLIGGIVKVSLTTLKTQLGKGLGKPVSVLLMCSLSGSLFGTFNFLFPLTVGPGTALLPPVIALGPQLSPGLLVSSTAIKMVSFWACSAGGLVGGIVFPMLLMGTMMGSVAATWTGVSRYIAITASFSVVGAAFIRLPAFWIFLTFLSFMVDQAALFPIFTAVFSANLAFAGLGIPQGLLQLSERRKNKQQASNGSLEDPISEPLHNSDSS